MKVRYNPVVGVALLVIGAVCEFLGVWLYLLGEFSPVVLTGLMPMLIGILYLVRPYFWVSPAAVEVTALVGTMRREYPFQALEAEGGRLVAVDHEGARKKVPVARWLAHSEDWAAATQQNH
ncbi:hypothetical protein [Amycolatopsis nigrescens]|uniref:hypothetical protein n=1 Tax=Amycolatopsis nigrescens TaxID=381445 RepID=UPI00037BC104|nr:hypothetical protein [Amycolatopsis nigrescens]